VFARRVTKVYIVKRRINAIHHRVKMVEPAQRLKKDLNVRVKKGLKEKSVKK